MIIPIYTTTRLILDGDRIAAVQDASFEPIPAESFVNHVGLRCQVEAAWLPSHRVRLDPFAGWTTQVHHGHRFVFAPPRRPTPAPAHDGGLFELAGYQPEVSAEQLLARALAGEPGLEFLPAQADPGLPPTPFRLAGALAR